MSVQVEKLEHFMAKLTITVPAEKFDKAIETAYKKMKNQISIPGFRKGKVPQKMVEKMYGASIFYDEAANIIIPEAYNEEANEITEIEITSQPSIELVQCEKGKAFIFEATVATMPEAQLGQYKGVEVAVSPVEVTDEDVEAEIKKALEKNAREIEAEVVADGDEIVLDYAGTIDGVAFDGGTAEDYKLTIGSGAFIPGFEEQLIGTEAGADAVVNVTFPEDYNAAELAGKAAVFNCTVKSIKRKELPEFDEEFVQDVSEFDTVEDYKADVKKGLVEKEEAAKLQEKQGRVIEAIVNNAEFDIPEPMVETEAKRITDRFAQQMTQYGLTMEMYLQYTGMTMETMVENNKAEALRDIKGRLVLAAVAKAENLEATEEELAAEKKSVADMYNLEVAKVDELLGPGAIKMMSADIVSRKALELVTAAAVEVEAAPAEAEEE